MIDVRLIVPSSQIFEALCCEGCNGCLVMQYNFIDSHNHLMRAWFSICKTTAVRLLKEGKQRDIDLTDEATFLAIIPDEETLAFMDVLSLQSEQRVH